MWIIADVIFDTDSEAREAERLAKEGKLAGVSVDLGHVTSELEIIEVDDDGWPTDWLETITEAEIFGATQVAMPAFADARIDFTDDGPIAYLAPEGMETSDRRIIAPGALTWRDNAPLMFNDSSDGHAGAVHVGNFEKFRRASGFDVGTDPGLGVLTRPFVADGELVGHGAGWGTCHKAFMDACVTAPQTGDYNALPVYIHPNGDVHAPLSLDVDGAQRWYQSQTELVGMARVGEDSHGIWVAGASSLDNGEYNLSRDWRKAGDDWELIAFLVVDNPGFPTALVADGVHRALIGAGMFDKTDLMSRIDQLEAQVEAFVLDRRAEILESAFG